jgi:hypothetical protein
MQMMWNFINLMQLIIMLPLMNVAFPMNAITLYKILMNIANFEVIPADLIYDKIFETKGEKLPPNFRLMKYETDNLYDNMGSQGLIFTFSIALTLVGMIIFAILKKIGRYN